MDGVPQALPAEFVIWAYRLFLDREPEDAAIVEGMRASYDSSHALRRAFMSCAEFRAQNTAVPPSTAVLRARKRLEIERIRDSVVLADFFAHVKNTWVALGRSEAYWSVLSAERFRRERIDQHMAEFSESGREEVANLFGLLHGLGIEPPADAECLEYGCGVGRVTRWLSERFKHVWACDISSSHLDIARRYLHDERTANVGFRLARELDDIERLPKVDFFYSMIVLQHNPPPLMEAIVTSLGKSLKAGGYGLFQVPTYHEGYSFGVSTYLDGLQAAGLERPIEMHVLPMERVFACVHDSGCIPVHVFADGLAGQNYESFSFLVRKP